MDDFLEQVARRRRQGAYTALYFAVWILIVLFGLTALMNLTSIIGMNAEGGVAFRFEALIIAVISGGITFLLWRRADYCRMEYDYTFTNGTLDVSQVLNNKRRRYLTARGSGLRQDAQRAGTEEAQLVSQPRREAVLLLLCEEQRQAHGRGGADRRDGGADSQQGLSPARRMDGRRGQVELWRISITAPPRSPAARRWRRWFAA